jgi:quercetin dioxygenase-like cupin family protein
MKNGSIIKSDVLRNEIEGILIDYISVRGPNQIDEEHHNNFYTVLLSLKGKAVLHVRGQKHTLNAHFIVRIPYNVNFTVQVEMGEEFHFVCLRKQLNSTDLNMISQNPHDHSSIYIKAFSDCPVYTEEIKSSKTINRMLLPVGLIPRFCMGSVETMGPDSVGEHEHPMLDQFFLGLEKCKCTVTSDGESQLLTENMMLHIPLGSKHSVSVAEDNLLSYIWFDFFFTLKGQDYIEDQHKMDD